MAKTQGILVHVNGRIESINIGDYRDIQNAVGGTFDLLTSQTGNTTFWFHDEGKLIGLPLNAVATAALWQLVPFFVGHDILVGPVLITGGADDEGDTLSISDEGLLTLGELVGGEVTV